MIEFHKGRAGWSSPTWSGYRSVALEREYTEPVVADGQCGPNAFWVLYETGMLEIYGSGSINDYPFFIEDSGEIVGPDPTPWIEYCDMIESLKISEGITRIGMKAFYGLKSLSAVPVFPQSISSFGYGAFENCCGMQGDLSFPASVKFLGECAFAGCDGVLSATFNGDAPVIDNYDDNSGMDMDGKTVFGRRDDSFIIRYKIGRTGWTTPYWYDYHTELIPVGRGDLNEDYYLNSDDAIYLLRHTMNKSRYPINQDGDIDGDGMIDSNDAIYLLRHIMKPTRYPLSN